MQNRIMIKSQYAQGTDVYIRPIVGKPDYVVKSIIVRGVGHAENTTVHSTVTDVLLKVIKKIYICTSYCIGGFQSIVFKWIIGKNTF